MTDVSRGNLDTVRGIYTGFASGDVGAVLRQCDPHVEWHEAENFIYADHSPYIGPDAVGRGVFQRVRSEWDGFAASPHEFLDAGDTIVALGHYTGVFRRTGRRVRAQFVHVFTFANGRIVRFQQFTDTAQFRDVSIST